MSLCEYIKDLHPSPVISLETKREENHVTMFKKVIFPVGLGKFLFDLLCCIEKAQNVTISDGLKKRSATINSS